MKKDKKIAHNNENSWTKEWGEKSRQKCNNNLRADLGKSKITQTRKKQNEQDRKKVFMSEGN